MKDNQIIIDPFNFISLLECSIIKVVNDHFYAHIAGYIDESIADESVLRCSSNEAITIRAIDEDNDSIVLFTGIVQTILVRSEGGLKRLEIDASSHSILLDKKEEIRVFQDERQTYNAVANHIAADTHSVFIYSDKMRQSTDGMVVQYKETDWVFLKRMASRQNTVLVADNHNPNTVVCLGVPKKTNVVDISSFSYSVKKDIGDYLFKNKNGVRSYHENDSVCFSVDSRQIFELCAPVNFMNRSLYIHKIVSHLVGNELIHTYYLGSKDGFSTVKTYNEKIMGASLEGKIKKVKTDIVKIEVPEDACGSIKWFPYSTVYSSPEGYGWYCMPELNDSVRLYFPNMEEDNAVVVSSIHLSDRNGLRNDPDMKSMRTIHDKEIRFTKSSILITNHKGTYIILDDKKGIKMITSKNIDLSANQDITIRAGTHIDISGKESVTLNQGTNSILVADGITQIAEIVQEK